MYHPHPLSFLQKRAYYVDAMVNDSKMIAGNFGSVA
jgi:hypothetical protein